MAQDPNPKVNLAGSGVLLHVRNPSGEFIPVQGDADGAIETVGGGGGGGDATAANQTTQIIAEQAIQAATEASEAWLASIDTSAANTANSVALVAADIGPIRTAVEALQSDTANTATNTDASAILLASIDTKIPASPSQDRTSPTAPSASRASNGTDFIDVALETTLDLVRSAVQAIRDRLPSALINGRLDGNVGAWLGSTAPTIGQKTMANSVPVTVASDQSKLIVEGLNAVGGTGAVKPVAVGGVIATTTTSTTFWTDSNGRIQTVGAAASGSAVTGAPVLSGGSDGTNARTIATTPAGAQIISFDAGNLGPFGDLIAEGKTSVLSRYWTILNAFDPQQDETVAQANGATVTVNAGRLTLTSGTTNAADAVYRSVKTAEYRPGQGYIFRWTASFTTGVTNSAQEIGFGNGTSGGGGNAIAVGFNGSAFGILHRNAGVSTWIAQTAWNGDRCNGTGPSGFTINPALGNVYFAHVPFLGYGNISFFIQDPVTSRLILAHTIRYANSSASTEFSDPAFRVYGRVVSTGSTTNLVAYCGSASAFTIGEIGNNGQQWAENRTLTVNGTAAIFSIRCATTVNGALNNTPIRVRAISFTSDNGNTTATGIASLGVTLGGTPVFAALTGKTATTANNGVTLTSATTIGTIDLAGTTITGGDPIWNTSTPRNSASMAGELEENPLFIFPGQTMTFYATTGAATSCTFSINGTVG